MKSVPRQGSLFSALVLLAIAGCGGDGCSCMGSIPGGFPDGERVPNAIQIRVSQSGIQNLQSDPNALIGGLVGTGGLTFDVPSDCSGSPEICCDNGAPTTPCGPIEIDLTEKPGDLPRLEISPVQGSSRLDVIMRARIRTVQDFQIKLGITCMVELDTELGGPNDDIRLEAKVDLVQDPDTGTTRVDVASVDVFQFDNNDVKLKPGNILCIGADWATGLFVDTLVTTFEDAIKNTISDQLCKQCPGGDAALECGPHATGCTDGVCMKGDVCLQELGIAGRMTAASVLGSLSPGTLGKLDVYEVAGGYATTDSGGVALGMLGGMRPAGTERDRCGPPSTAPPPATIPESTFFQGNTRPDTGETFDFAVGIHQHNLDMFSYAAYEGGFLCLNIGTSSVDLLQSETLGILFGSLVDLLHGQVGQIVMGLRPQEPPVIKLGLNTFRLEGSDQLIDDPLLDITMKGLEIDFFAQVDDQFIRIMTLVTDVQLPINLEVDANGDLVPVLGDVENGFTNISVKNSQALIEDPAELANKFPALLSLAVPLIADGLGGFALPELAGLKLKIAPNGITSVDNKTFLAIFGTFDLAPTAAAAPARTEARVTSIRVPETAAFVAKAWDKTKRPRIELALGGTDARGVQANLEWSYRINHGLWSPYTRSAELSLSRRMFWLQGKHTIEVRAREIGKPETTDPIPVVLRPIIDTFEPRVTFTQRAKDTVWVRATDNVTAAADLRIEHRLADGEWKTTTALPARIELAGHQATELQVRVTDEAGNSFQTRPPRSVEFHGSGGAGSGCGCAAGQGAESARGTMALLVLVCLGLLGSGRRPAIWRVARRAMRGASPLVLVLGLGLVAPAGCSCGSAASPCFGDVCAEGEVERGNIGRYSDIVLSGDRVMISAYDDGLGDLVLVELADDDSLVYTPIDGVPREDLPVYEPDTYRDGIAGAGKDVGAWTSIAATSDGQARIAYQDVDNGYLLYAAEYPDTWQLHAVDAGTGGGRVGLHTSIAMGPGGAPAIAYLAVGIDDGSGGKLAQLRYAQASSPDPVSEADWAVAILDETAISCAGLCGDGKACIADAASGAETCQLTSSDCADACSDTQACLASTCTDFVPDPAAHDMPRGTGLFSNLLHLPSGNPVIVYYDREQGELAIQVFDSTWSKTIIDGSIETDTGMFASASVDTSGTVHIAYQEALSDQLLYTTWTSGGAVAPVEIVDDGVRAGDRPHPVGASAALFLQSGSEPAVLYQDAATSDVALARRSGSGWTREDLLSGAELYGFFLRVAQNGSQTISSSYFYDRAIYPPGALMITTIP